jgi:hypothetical protein
MDTAALASLVSNVGFPIAVAVYALVVLGKKLDQQTALLQKLIDLHTGGRPATPSVATLAPLPPIIS